MPGAQLIALCDPMEENLEAARKEIDVPYLYRDYREALAYAGRGFAGVSGISRGGTAFMARKAD